MPERIQTGNGSEFISIVMDRWAYDHGVTMDYSRPGKLAKKVQPARIGGVPYRNGAMCTASAVLQTVHDGNHYSTIEGARLLRESIHGIISN